MPTANAVTGDAYLRLLDEADARELHALTVWRLNRVEIVVATGNRRSRAREEGRCGSPK